MDDVTSLDLLAAAADQKPSDFEAVFDRLMADRVVAAIDARKIEVAQSIFNEPEEEIEGEVETDDEDA